MEKNFKINIFSKYKLQNVAQAHIVRFQGLPKDGTNSGRISRAAKRPASYYWSPDVLHDKHVSSMQASQDEKTMWTSTSPPSPATIRLGSASELSGF